MFRSEEDVLKPKDPTIENDDDWEEFRLSNAEVRDEKTGKLTSLLNAFPNSPVIVRGKLQLAPGQTRFLLKKSQGNGTNVEVEDIGQYAYGQDDKEQFEFWAAGEAGWFLVKPSKTYKTIYDEMIESVKLLYFLADLFKRRPKTRSVKTIFEAYANVDDSCNTWEEAEEKFNAHKDFLIMAMLQKYEGVNWRTTSFYQHMRQNFASGFVAIERRLKDSPEEKSGELGSPLPQPSKLRGGPSRIQTRQTQVREPLRSSSRLPKTPQTSNVSISKPHPNVDDLPKKLPKDDAWFRAQVIWRLIQTAQKYQLLDSDEMTVDGIANLMIQQYDIDDQHQAADYIRAHASILIWLMTKYKKNHDWTEDTVYDELLGTKLSPKVVDELSQLRVRRRREATLTRDDDNDSVSSASTDRPGPPRGKGTSVLRPRSGRYSGKYRRAHMEQPDEMDTDSSREDIISPTKRKTKTRDTANPRKRHSVRIKDPPSDEGIDMEVDEDEDEEEFADEGNPILPLRWKAESLESTGNNHATHNRRYKPTVVAEPSIQSNWTANLPGDVWACPWDGCVHKVYGASSDDSQKMMRDHYESHMGPGEQEEIVKREGSGTHLPVENLLRRIREMADKQAVLPPQANGADDIQRIRRRY